MSQNQGWGQPQDQSGWGQQPQQSPPPGSQPGGQPPQWGAPPPTNQSSFPSKHCPACGSVIDAKAVDCPRCGVRQPDVVYVDGKSRVVAAWLALLLGWLGIHRFYLGQALWGVIYILFFWTLIPGIVAIFEAIYYLSRTNEQWAQMYGGPVRQPNSIGLGCGWILAILAVLNVAWSIYLLFTLL